jgi:serine O-acetyltransferase
MEQHDLVFLVRSDLHRYCGSSRLADFCRHYFTHPGFRFSAWLRLYQWSRGRRLLALGVRQLISLMLRRQTYRFGIDISPDTQIGPGLYIGHFGGIVVNRDVVIGRNLNLSQGVTLGQVNRGARKGCPVIGDDVYIGPGAKVLGKVVIGSRAAIGANAVVIHDVTENTSVAGVPARLVSERGSAGYVNRTDYAGSTTVMLDADHGEPM